MPQPRNERERLVDEAGQAFRIAAAAAAQVMEGCERGWAGPTIQGQLRKAISHLTFADTTLAAAQADDTEMDSHFRRWLDALPEIQTKTTAAVNKAQTESAISRMTEQ